MSKTAIDVLLGTAAYGFNPPALTDKAEIQRILDLYKSHGHNQLDNARVYGGGTSETLFGELKYAEQGFVLDTKINSFSPGAHKAENIQKSLQASLEALKTNKVRVLYLHAPERTTPLEEALGAINDAYKKGHFELFGLSNFSAAEVEQVVQIAKEKGYVPPKVYQGLYNLVTRSGEGELFPVLRKHGIRFYAYSPLAGGFFSPQISKDFQPPPNSRFDPNSMIGQMYRGFFFKDSHFEGLEKLKKVAAEHGLQVQELAIRWIVHHSVLKREYHDGIITGGRTYEHIKNTLEYAERPPLPEAVVKVIDEVWDLVKHEATSYHR